MEQQGGWLHALNDELLHETLLPFLTWSDARSLMLTCREFYEWRIHYTDNKQEPFSHQVYMARRFGASSHHPITVYKWLLCNTKKWHHCLRNTAVLEQHYGNYGRRQLCYNVHIGTLQYRIQFRLPGHSTTNLPPELCPTGVRFLSCTGAGCTQFMMSSPKFTTIIYHWMRKLYIQKPTVKLITT